ncbi:MAG: type II toxin-antitoxin system VapC family toxin [Chloroflexia bacterium]
MPSTVRRPAEQAATCSLLDAGIFIGALLRGDPRHLEARALVESARYGDLPACTTIGILCEVYGALTWEGACPPHDPAVAAEAVRVPVEPPSAIHILKEGSEVIRLALELAATHHLTARRIHDARHAAAALLANVRSVYTYDLHDWQAFEGHGLIIAGPPSVLLSR